MRVKLTPAQLRALGWHAFDDDSPPKGKVRKKRATPEADFQKQVVELAQRCGWRVAHFRKVRVQRPNGSIYFETPVAADGAGFPDLVLVKGDQVLWVELKAKQSLSPEQKLWHEALRTARQTVLVWRPKDWDAIKKTLTRGYP